MNKKIIFNEQIQKDIVTTIINSSVVVDKIENITFSNKNQELLIIVTMTINNNIYNFSSLLSELAIMLIDKIKSQLDLKEVYIDFKIL